MKKKPNKFFLTILTVLSVLKRLFSQKTTKYKTIIKITTSAALLYQTLVLNDSKNKLFSYDNLGCWNTNFDRVGVGDDIKSTTGNLSDVKNIGEPKNVINCVSNTS